MTAQGLLPIYHQASELSMPGMGALHLPPTRLSTRLRRELVTATTLERNMPKVALFQDDLTRRSVIEGGIQTQVVGGIPRRLRTDDRHMVEQRGQHWAVVDIGRGGQHAHWDSAPIHQQVVFMAGFAAVGGIGPGLFFPPVVPGRGESGPEMARGLDGVAAAPVQK